MVREWWSVTLLRWIRVSAHVGLFLVALVVFTLGTGVGLARNPTAGTLLWLAAALIVAGNIWWIMRSSRR